LDFCIDYCGMNNDFSLVDNFKIGWESNSNSKLLQSDEYLVNFADWVLITYSIWNHAWSQSRSGPGLNWTFVFITFVAHCCSWLSFDWLLLLMAKPMQYSIFGSILTIGAMIGAVVSGRIADYAGRRVVSQSIAA